MKKSLVIFLLAIVITGGLILQWSSLVSLLSNTLPQIFELKDDSSWVEEKRIWGDRSPLLTQDPSQKNIKSTLLSRDAWRDLTVSFLIYNPRNCGVVFHYIDEDNYDFLFHDTTARKLIWGVHRQGLNAILRSEPLDALPIWPLTLKILGNNVAAFVNSELFTEMNYPASFGRFGVVSIEIASPKTSFGGFWVQGETPQGLKTFRPSLSSSERIPDALYLFYILFLGTAVCVKNIFVGFFIKEKISIPLEHQIYNFLAFTIGAFVFGRVLQTWFRLEGEQFQNVFLWHNFAIALLGFGLIYVLALSYHKLFQILSLPALFIAFPFLFYFLSLINLVTFKIPDVIFLWLCWLGFFVPSVILMVRRKLTPDWKKLKDYPWSGADWLLLLWVAHGLLYFMEANFNLGRNPQSDENNFWFAAPLNMLSNGFLKAHLASYPSGLVHSFGIPFLWALPAKFFGVSSPTILFFAPIFIILSLLIFLDTLRPRRWLFLFFYLAMVDTVNLKGDWISFLFYGLLYGEAISAIFLLILTFELKKIGEMSSLTWPNVFAVSLCLGLLVLSKSPVSYLSPVLFVVFLMMNFEKIRSIKIKTSIIPVILTFLAPFIVWKIFGAMNAQESNPFLITLKKFTFSGQGKEMLGKVWPLMKLSFAGSFKYIVASVLCILIVFRGKEFFLAVPAVLLCVVLLIYYRFIYIAGDEVSSVRYCFPVLLSLFYLGAVGFDRMIKRRA